MMVGKRNIYFDLLNTIACIMVVYFHCNSIFYSYSNTISWKISVIERCIVYSAVPIFFMLTGAKLLTYRDKYSTKEYFKKRIIRTGIPFIFWNLFYIALDFVFGGFEFDNVQEFISAFINSEFQNRYWFFFPLFSLYAAIPLVSLFLKIPNHRKYLWYLVTVTFTISWFMKPLLTILGISFNKYLEFPLGGGFIMYAVFGYLVATGEWHKKHRWLLYSATLISELFVIIFTIFVSAKDCETNTYILNYLYFPSALMAASIFVFFRHLNTKRIGDRVAGFFRFLSGCNMGVWLTHSIGIVLIQKITDVPNESYFLRFIAPIIIYSICVVGTYIVKKIPFVKYTV